MKVVVSSVNWEGNQSLFNSVFLLFEKELKKYFNSLYKDSMTGDFGFPTPMMSKNISITMANFAGFFSIKISSKKKKTFPSETKIRDASSRNWVTKFSEISACVFFYILKIRRHQISRVRPFPSFRQWSTWSASALSTR